MENRRFGRHILPVTTAVAAAVSLSGCGRSTEYADQDVKVCGNSSGKRIPDRECEGKDWPGATQRSAGAHWFFIARGSPVPGIGGRLTSGSTTARSGASYARASDVARGGFGNSARVSARS